MRMKVNRTFKQLMEEVVQVHLSKKVGCEPRTGYLLGPFINASCCLTNSLWSFYSSVGSPCIDHRALLSLIFIFDKPVTQHVKNIDLQLRAMNDS